jgi:lipoprotein signal peptidase
MKETEPPDAESLRLELREAITAFQNQLTLMAQSIGLIITADTLLLAYGFVQKRSGILLLASLLPIVMLVVFYRNYKYYRSHFVRCNENRKKAVA